MILREFLKELVPYSQMVQLCVMQNNGNTESVLQDDALNLIVSDYKNCEIIEVRTLTDIKQMLVITVSSFNSLG